MRSMKKMAVSWPDVEETKENDVLHAGGSVKFINGEGRESISRESKLWSEKSSESEAAISGSWRKQGSGRHKGETGRKVPCDFGELICENRKAITASSFQQRRLDSNKKLHKIAARPRNDE
ncbi:hypothetical protein KM043_013199 [Ampulex compressa]|nr:hypothetical protein KM043_013199 [Ampulex compressa]